MARNGLIFPVPVVIAQLDTTEMEWDHVLREPKVVYTNGVRSSGRVEKETRIEIPAQVEPDAKEAQFQGPGGDASESRLALTMSFVDLRRLNLLDDDGAPKIRKNDRLVEIKKRDGTTGEKFPEPPGMYAIEVRSLYGVGQRGPTHLLVRFQGRPQGTRGRP